jgi:hypothetical protein
MRAYAQMMGLTLAERRAITETTATRYQLASKRGKGVILDELCANTGWHRNHARKALTAAREPRVVTPRSPRRSKYGPDVIAALTVCWTVLGTPAGKRLAPMLAALNDIAYKMPFPILGVDSDNGSEFINVYLLQWCEKHQITFTRARPGNKNDGCHVEQKNWAVVRTVVGYNRYDTAAELLLLNEIWQLQSKLTNYFYPQQKLISKVRHGAKVAKKYDTAATPFHRAIDHPTMTEGRIVGLATAHARINPAAIQRQIQALTAQLLKMATSKTRPANKAPVPKRAHSYEGTNQPSRAS